MAQKKVLLTLAIPTFNEEANIHIPLDSAYDMADEVLVVDGGSTDKTVEIAKRYGSKVRILNVDNPSNFLVNKQRAIDNAKGEWILQLDADERLSKELKKEIENWKLKIGNSNPVVGYWIPRKNWFLGRFLMKGGVYPDAVLRLYRRDKAHFKLENVHENAIVDGGETKWTTHALEHMADPTFARYLQRWHRYNTFDAKQLVEKGAKLCPPCYFIGKPLITFFSIYLRHKGFMDGYQGLVWAFFSSIRYWEIYWKVGMKKV